MQDLSVFAIQPVQLVHDGTTYWLAYLINESGDGLDQLLLDSDDSLVVSRDVTELEGALRDLGIQPHEESQSVFVDGHEVTSLVSLDDLTPMPCTIDDSATADRLWNGWSMLDDICLTIGRPLKFQGEIAKTLFDKLFWGMNLEAVTPPGEVFRPVMSKKERAKWNQIITVAHQRVATAMPKI